MLLLCALCLAVPVPIVGLGVLKFYTAGLDLADATHTNWIIQVANRAYDSALLPVTALWIRTFPIAALIMWYAFRTLPQATLDAASLDGAGQGRSLATIALPARWHAVAITWIVSFLLAWGDLAASQPLTPAGMDTLALRIFDRLHSGADDQVSGICLALLIALGGTTVLLAVIWRCRPNRA